MIFFSQHHSCHNLHKHANCQKSCFFPRKLRMSESHPFISLAFIHSIQLSIINKPLFLSHACVAYTLVCQTPDRGKKYSLLLCIPV